MTGNERAGGPRPVVLVIQDEPILAMAMEDCVLDAGCEAVLTSNAAAAIAILEARTDIRVVFADLDVRGSVMGLRLAALVRDRWPPIELVLTGARAPEQGLIPARGVFCRKPFDEAGIVAAIRRFAA